MSKYFEPNRKKVIGYLHNTCTREIIQVDINPKIAVHLKLVLIYKNTRITAADDEFYTMLEEILLSQVHNMNVSSWKILIFQT